MDRMSTLIYFVNNYESCKGFPENKGTSGFLSKKPDPEAGPSEKTIESILDFARSYEVFETEVAGYVEMTLN